MVSAHCVPRPGGISQDGVASDASFIAPSSAWQQRRNGRTHRSSDGWLDGHRSSLLPPPHVGRSVIKEQRKTRVPASGQRAHCDQHPVRHELEKMGLEIKFCWVNITPVPAVKNNEMSSGWPSEIMQSAERVIGRYDSLGFRSIRL